MLTSLTFEIRQYLGVNDVNQESIGILASLPVHLKAHLLDKMELIFSNTIKDIDSAVEQKEYTSLHFDWYNRYATRVSPNPVHSSEVFVNGAFRVTRLLLIFTLIIWFEKVFPRRVNKLLTASPDFQKKRPTTK